MYITNKLYLTNDQKETNLTLYIHFISDLWAKQRRRKSFSCEQCFYFSNKKESAVILYQEFFYDYHKFATNVRYTSGIRKRIKLLDKISVDDFSEFSFIKKFRVKRGYWGRKGKKFVGIKIIKPNGKVREIEIGKEATQTDNKKEYKIAIPGLEVGDIIDYYVHTVEPFKQRYGYTFESIKRPLNDIFTQQKNLY